MVRITGERLIVLIVAMMIKGEALAARSRVARCK